LGLGGYWTYAQAGKHIASLKTNKGDRVAALVKLQLKEISVDDGLQARPNQEAPRRQALGRWGKWPPR